jgi:hypothetical protein
MENVVGYCMKCKKKVSMVDIKVSKTKKGVTMRKGKCPKCSTVVCRMGNIK